VWCGSSDSAAKEGKKEAMNKGVVVRGSPSVLSGQKVLIKG
jgi:hypothetical protein